MSSAWMAGVSRMAVCWWGAVVRCGQRVTAPRVCRLWGGQAQGFHRQAANDTSPEQPGHQKHAARPASGGQPERAAGRGPLFHGQQLRRSVHHKSGVHYLRLPLPPHGGPAANGLHLPSELPGGAAAALVGPAALAGPFGGGERAQRRLRPDRHRRAQRAHVHSTAPLYAALHARPGALLAEEDPRLAHRVGNGHHGWRCVGHPCQDHGTSHTTGCLAQRMCSSAAGLCHVPTSGGGAEGKCGGKQGC